jgi:hypothetical protein
MCCQRQIVLAQAQLSLQRGPLGLVRLGEGLHTLPARWRSRLAAPKSHETSSQTFRFSFWNQVEMHEHPGNVTVDHQEISESANKACEN